MLAHLRHGQVLTVLERYEKWTYVKTGTVSGYVSNDYIIYDAEGGEEETQPPQQPEQGAAAQDQKVAIVLADDGLNLRTRASRTGASSTMMRFS